MLWDSAPAVDVGTDRSGIAGDPFASTSFAALRGISGADLPAINNHGSIPVHHSEALGPKGFHAHLLDSVQAWTTGNRAAVKAAGRAAAVCVVEAAESSSPHSLVTQSQMIR
jgi:hypothetical protein